MCVAPLSSKSLMTSKLLRNLGVKWWNNQSAWCGFGGEVESVRRRVEVKMKQKFISRARKSEFLKVSKYEKKVNSKKV